VRGRVISPRRVLFCTKAVPKETGHEKICRARASDCCAAAATRFVDGVVSPGGTHRVAETPKGKGGWDGALCDRHGDLRHVLDTWTPAVMERMGTYGPTGVPSLSVALPKAGDCLGSEVRFVGTERYMALVRTLRDGSCLPTRAGVDLGMRLSAARQVG